MIDTDGLSWTLFRERVNHMDWREGKEEELTGLDEKDLMEA